MVSLGGKILIENLKTVVVTDCGSTTTKAVMFEKTENGWRQTYRGESPTTVEEPVADVTIGVRNSLLEIQQISGRKLLKDNFSEQEIPFNINSSDGLDLYLSTSSAGGGLQMIVAGVVSDMSTRSAERAALGAGAIVLESLSADDGKQEHERVQRIRHLRPDIVLLTGGVDGGASTLVIEAAEILRAASPKPRFGDSLKLPVVYAGNKDIAEEIKTLLGDLCEVIIVDNVRPSLGVENIEEAREAIHEFFLSHVMSHAPGYSRLINWTPVPIMPTPRAFGDIVCNFAHEHNIQILAVDIGGATTDMFSLLRGDKGDLIYNRTVSANLGMSYSMANVLKETGLNNIMRWYCYDTSESEIRNRIRNKMIRPTSIPQTLEDLHLEQAICREALRLSLEHHSSIASRLVGVSRNKGIAEIFDQQINKSLLNMKGLDLVIGSGGVLSHAPNRVSAALMMIDGFALEGVTQIAVDSIFMMPHLGILASIHSEAANEILMRDCLVFLGASIVPIYQPGITNTELAEVFLDGKKVGVVLRDQVSRVNFEEGASELEVRPILKSIDIGEGKGKTLTKKLLGGSMLILDGRNRPIKLSENTPARLLNQQKIMQSLGIDL